MSGTRSRGMPPTRMTPLRSLVTDQSVERRQQRDRVGVPRRVDLDRYLEAGRHAVRELRWRPECQQRAAAEHRDAVAQRLRLDEIVRAQHNRATARARQLANRLVELLRGCRVETRRRLIEKQQVGIVDERSRQREALLHSAAESADAIVRALGDAELLEQRLGARRDLRRPVRRTSRRRPEASRVPLGDRRASAIP